MTDAPRISDRVGPGMVVRISTDLVERFPVGTVITSARHRILTANVPVNKPGEPQRIAHIDGEPGETVDQLADRVRTVFPRPLSPE